MLSTMKIFGWILTIIGGLGTIISQLTYTEAENDYSNRFSSALYGTTSDMSYAETARLIFIIVFLLGIVFLIIGYALSAKQQSVQSRLQYNGTFFANTPSATPTFNSTQVKCPSCKNIVDGSFPFCGKCGNPLKNAQQIESFCVKCGQKIRSNQVFCPHCGTKKR